MRVAVRFALVPMVLVFAAGLAHAQAFRTYIASYGSDSNPCTIAAPCRLLPAAMNAVVDKGEVWMLDSANYNASTVSISKNVTVMAVPGVVGSLVATQVASAVNVTASVTVKFRNLVFVRNEVNQGPSGIVNANGTSPSIFVEDSVFNFEAEGINLVGGRLSVKNSTFRGANSCIRLQGVTIATISGSTFTNCANGIAAVASAPGTDINVGITDSVISGATSFGLLAWVTPTADAASKVVITATGVRVVNGSQGVMAQNDFGGGSSALVSFGSGAVTGNSVGFHSAGTGALVESAGNNVVRNNVNDVWPATTLGTFAPM